MPKKKRGIGRLLRMKTILALNLVVFGMVAWGFGGEYVRNRELEGEIDDLKDTATIMTQKNVELAEMRERFAGAGQLEREARLKLNLMRPGEQVVVIKEGVPVPARREETTTENARAPAPEERKVRNVEKWFDYLFKHDE